MSFLIYLYYVKYGWVVEMPRRSAEVEKWVQRIDEDLKEDMTLYPSEIPVWYVDNEVKRVLAHLVGVTEDGKAKRIKVTAEGLLKVSAYPAVFEEYTVKKGTGSDDYTAENIFEFSESYNRWDILLEGGDAIISFKKANGTWGEDITLPEGFHSYEFSALGIKIKNRNAGVNVSYEITAFR